MHDLDAGKSAQNKLYEKYDIKAPRYTSYPPMPFWNGEMNGEKWARALSKGIAQNPQADLYVHIPFCRKLCWYCGCNRIITRDEGKAREYVAALIKEFEMYAALMPPFKVRSLHFGGGTPNFLEPALLDGFLAKLAANFDSQEFEGAAEIDPRTCDKRHLEVLSAYGFKRVSFGVQDFDQDVQKAINRIQTFELVEQTTSRARRLGFEHVNFDLIWGLPKQTPETVEKTMDAVVELAPEQISYYSYAHLPQRFKHQRLIKSEDILRGERKRELCDRGKELLEAKGYVEIGMDHFAKKGSLLHLAANKGRLKRNFMGYTDKKAPNLLGLGASSISSNDWGFVQNLKDAGAWAQAVDEGRLPIANGHENFGEDAARSEIIQELMCNMRLESADVRALENGGEIIRFLEDVADDGLLERKGGEWLVTPLGKKFVRGVAAAFDSYLPRDNTVKSFSQTV